MLVDLISAFIIFIIISYGAEKIMGNDEIDDEFEKKH